MKDEPVIVVQADLARAEHQAAILELLNGYSSDPMADGVPLADETRQNLIPALQRHPTTHIFLAFHAGVAVGLAICFLGFSTFAARPLLNIHDFYVAATHRGAGISRRMMEAIERRARELNCCKITLEVLEGNHRARSVYAASGFAQAQNLPGNGGALFLSKSLK